MPESVIGTLPAEVIHQTKSTEGSLSVAYNSKDLIANTIGHLFAIPTTHLVAWTFRNAFQNPPEVLAQQIHDRWKDVPWKGDVLVRVGHASVIGDVQRMYASHDTIRGRPVFGFGKKLDRIMDFVVKTSLLPSIVVGSLKSKIFRQDNYNPFTNTVTVFHPRLGVGMHEMGHAEFYNQLPEGKRKAYAIAKLVSDNVKNIPFFYQIPIITSFMEYRASALAMKRFASDIERLRELKVMEPGYATYLMRDLLLMTIPFVGFTPLMDSMLNPFIKFSVGQGAPDVIKHLFNFEVINGILAGSISANILARLPYPGRRQRFEWVFGGKKDQKLIQKARDLVYRAHPLNQLETHQVRYALASSATQ